MMFMICWSIVCCEKHAGKRQSHNRSDDHVISRLSLLHWVEWIAEYQQDVDHDQEADEESYHCSNLFHHELKAQCPNVICQTLMRTFFVVMPTFLWGKSVTWDLAEGLQADPNEDEVGFVR